jgi:predicted CoA-binding protein
MRTPDSIARFLEDKRIAVAGVSREPRQTANVIFRKLKTSGYDVVPINPRAASVESVTCYPDLASAPGPIDGVVVVTPPAAAAGVVRQCADCGIRRVWLHRSVGQGSVSGDAVRACADGHIDCIVGGCPMMFCEPVDIAHKCLRWWLY